MAYETPNVYMPLLRQSTSECVVGTTLVPSPVIV
jgi:hypothetical protein